MTYFYLQLTFLYKLETNLDFMYSVIDCNYVNVQCEEDEKGYIIFICARLTQFPRCMYKYEYVHGDIPLSSSAFYKKVMKACTNICFVCVCVYVCMCVHL